MIVRVGVAVLLLAAAAAAAPAGDDSPLSVVEDIFGMRFHTVDADGGVSSNPSGTTNPAVPVNQTFNETLALALSAGLITQQQIDAICSFKLGVYSYYWSVVGDPQTTVRGVARRGGDSKLLSCTSRPIAPGDVP